MGLLFEGGSRLKGVTTGFLVGLALEVQGVIPSVPTYQKQALVTVTTVLAVYSIVICIAF